MASKLRRESHVRATANPFVPRLYWENHNREEDEGLAQELFFGRTVNDKTGRTKIEYPVQGSKRERSAKEALIRLLTHHSDVAGIKVVGDLCDALKGEGKGERRLVFQFRQKGKRRNLSGDYAVALYVATKGMKDGSVEAAVSEAMSFFGLSRKAVFAKMQRVKNWMKSWNA